MLNQMNSQTGPTMNQFTGIETPGTQANVLFIADAWYQNFKGENGFADFSTIMTFAEIFKRCSTYLIDYAGDFKGVGAISEATDDLVDLRIDMITEKFGFSEEEIKASYKKLIKLDLISVSANFKVESINLTNVKVVTMGKVATFSN